ncbi:hypothetical protein [Halomonas sp. B23F22_10]|uniref:hypothetical protein n=1 Tax=Halomonas sp. B23F22_10 TaxID=3459515 RepID=UPI00373F2D2F
MIICVESQSIEVAQHPVFTYYATSRDGRVFTRPAVRFKGMRRAGPLPRASHWVEVAQFTVQPKYTPPYRKCRVTQDGKTKIVSVHRFMLECWIGIQPRSQIVRHLNGDALRNELDNLAYGTVKENVEDAFRHSGNYAEGAKNGRARLTECDVRDIRARFDSGESVPSISPDYPQVSNNSVANAAKRFTWSHLA